jgi:hypothetical protein
MMFFGHTGYWLDPNAALEEVTARWQRATDNAERLLEVLLQLGEVVQAVLDHDLKRAGTEPPSTERSALRAALHGAAAEYVSAPRGCGAHADGRRYLVDAASSALPSRVEARLVEGFSHYAVLPEMYAQVASSLRRDRFASYPRTCVSFEQRYAGGALPFRRPTAATLRWSTAAFMDLSGGRWRHLCFPSAHEFPPAQRCQRIERDVQTKPASRATGDFHAAIHRSANLRARQT